MTTPLPDWERDLLIEHAARYAVLDVMGWEDDQGQPATYDVPAEPLWTLAGEIVDAVIETLREHRHREVR